MPRRISFFFILALLISAALSIASDRGRGQFTPVIARQKLSYIAKDMQGNEKVLYAYVGEYLRSSDGSELATLGLPSKNADPNMPFTAPSEGRLRTARDGSTYKLDYKSKTATLISRQSPPLQPHTSDSFKKESLVGRENIEGRRCTGVTVMSHGDETGTEWRDLKADILVRLESYFGSKEDHVRVVLQRFDIATRQEPDASLFTIPAKWTVITPEILSPVANEAATAPTH